MDIIINNKVKLNENEIRYNNEGYELIYNRVEETIKEIQDGDINGETEKINTINDIIEIENSFYIDWDYVGYVPEGEEIEFFNEIKKLYI